MAVDKRAVRSKLNVVRGFRHFVSDYGIVPLAVGVVIGTAVNDVVKSLVADIITPFIGLISPQGRLQEFQVVVHGSVFRIGHALNSLISFLVIALTVYAVAKFVLRNEELLKK